jgi:transcriptional regulator with XRE-family HTH domain
VGRRIAHSRTRAGLSRAELAHAVGADPSYLRYIEEQNAAPGTAVLLRIANALGVSLAELRGTAAGCPEGRGRAAAAPVLEEMDEAECRRRIGAHGVGRVGFTTPETGPVILPLNYTLVDGELTLRSTEGGPLAHAADDTVAFEVDRVDEALSAGWSVLVTGTLRQVADPERVRALARASWSGPWAGGARATWFTLRPERVTGRIIRT